MRRFITIGMLFIGIQFFLPAQNFINEYGKVAKVAKEAKEAKEDVDLNSYAKDKSADAVVIYDIGNSYFSQTTNSYELIYERTTRIKIFKEAGIKWANIEIPYYQQGNVYEQIEDVEACTYNFENGSFTKTPLKVGSSNDEQLNEFWKVRKFALPNVKEGSIIEYHYKINSQYMFNLRNWKFQWKIPVIYSKYTVKMIPFYEYTYLLQGATKFDEQKSYQDNGIDRQFGSMKYQDMIHEYVMKDVPAFKDEEYISSTDDYIIKLDFQLSKVTQITGSVQKVMTTWPDMIKDLIKNDDFGKYIEKSGKQYVKIWGAKPFFSKTPSERYDSIMNYVKANFRWNKMNGKYATKSVNSFLKDKTGNDAEINLFALGLLKSSGINATPIILSTRENGTVKYDYPYSHFFNYVCILVDIDGKKILTDATDPLLLNNRIPEKCINDKGLIIQNDKVEWVMLQSAIPSKIQSIIKIDLTELTQNSEIETSSTEYDALHQRDDNGSKTNAIQKELAEKGYSVVDSSIVVKNQTNITKPYTLKYKVVSIPEKINDKIYISPFLHETLKENPLKQTARTYPIDMIYPTKRSYFSEINIPKGYKVEFLPESDRIKNDQFEFEYTAVSDESKVHVNLAYNFKLSVYNPEDYLKVKYYFNQILNKGLGKIVFVKI